MPSLSLSRTAGVAPLAVHGYAFVSDQADGENAFLDYQYDWNFGDTESGDWPTSGRSRNQAKGASAAHVYESPGSFQLSLTVRRNGVLLYSESATVTVDDPQIVFAGDKTICVSDMAHQDFSSAPSGALCISTDDLSTVTSQAQAGRRILFHRGSSWTTAGLSWPGNAGPVSIGAYGEGSLDGMGLYLNAPIITVTGGSFLPLDYKQDWRIADLDLRDPSLANGSIGGSAEIQRILLMRLRVTGFWATLGWSHWNTAALMPLSQMCVWNCDLSGAEVNVLYCGSEYLAVLGNRVRDARTSHAARIWQAHKGVISHNLISGASYDTGDGRHALKLHGPGHSTLEGVNEYGTPLPDTSLLANRTSFVVVSDNAFGSSGPWPVNIAPQDGLTDALLENIVFERNRISSQYGTQSSTRVQMALRVHAREVMVRNNLLDGTGSGSSYTGIQVFKNEGDRAPDPSGVRILNNTVYRMDGSGYVENTGIRIASLARKTQALNNLFCFQEDADETYSLIDQGTDSLATANLLVRTSPFVDPANADPRARDFSLLPGAQAIDAGQSCAVHDDFFGLARNSGALDIGAVERR